MDQWRSMFELSDDIDPKSANLLVQALKKNNQEGFDYIEFKQSYNALIKMPMDPPMAMKSAFTTAGTMGLTKETLLKSAEFYKLIIQKEKAQFDVALKNQNSQKIDARKQDQTNLQLQIDRNKELISKLDKEVAEYQQKIDKIDAEIKESLEKIEASRYKFEHTFAEVISAFNKDIEAIKSTL